MGSSKYLHDVEKRSSPCVIQHASPPAYSPVVASGGDELRPGGRSGSAVAAASTGGPIPGLSTGRTRNTRRPWVGGHRRPRRSPGDH